MKVLYYCLLLALLLDYAVNGKEVKPLKYFRSVKVQAEIQKPLNGGRVVGGENAEVGFAPYQVGMLNWDGSYRCGGAIIDRYWILTASHCVDELDEDELWIVTGTNQWQYPGAVHAVNKIIMHEWYNHPTLHNDIALLRLEIPIVFNERTQAIALPDVQLADGAAVILTGWGATSPYTGAMDNLQKVTLRYWENDKCRAALFYDPDFGAGHICTFTKAGEGSCYGDSGGPLVANGKLVGIVNWGYPCALGYPDVFASPLYYRSWIQNVINSN